VTTKSLSMFFSLTMTSTLAKPTLLGAIATPSSPPTMRYRTEVIDLFRPKCDLMNARVDLSHSLNTAIP